MFNYFCFKIPDLKQMLSYAYVREVFKLNL